MTNDSYTEGCVVLITSKKVKSSKERCFRICVVNLDVILSNKFERNCRVDLKV